MSNLSEMSIIIKASGLRKQYDNGLELYFDCLEQIKLIKTKSSTSVDKQDLRRARSRMQYYGNLNRGIDKVILENEKLQEKTKP